MKKVNKGFTLIELLVVIGIIAILAAIVIVSINPAKRFQDARNSQRQANVESILNAIQQNIVDNDGIFTCEIDGTVVYDADTLLPDTADVIGSGAGSIDLIGEDPDTSDCLGQYLATLPVDPQIGEWVDRGDYDTGYEISMDPDTKQVTITAPQSEEDGYDPNDDGTEDIISVTR